MDILSMTNDGVLTVLRVEHIASPQAASSSASLTVITSERLTTNVKAMMVADIDGDGACVRGNSIACVNIV